MHFGHCEQLVLIEVEPDGKTIGKKQYLTSPPHEPGALPRWLQEQGATVIIAGGMGSRAQSLFSQNGIQVVIGAEGREPDAIVRSFLDGELETGANACDH
jgi:predicted Fe-Mo cluster-binding NifX family protein